MSYGQLYLFIIIIHVGTELESGIVWKTVSAILKIKFSVKQFCCPLGIYTSRGAKIPNITSGFAEGSSTVALFLASGW